MVFEQLTLQSVEARAVTVPLNRPVVSKIGGYRDWPLILIDLYTAEGIVGRSYLEPYLQNSLKYILPIISDLASERAGTAIRPLDDSGNAHRALNIVGYDGLTAIAIAGLDMAAWDALAKAAGMPLAVFLGGALEPVPAYNSNGLWLTDIAALADEAAELVEEGGFTALKLRLGRERLADDLRSIETIREAVGADVTLMTDFNQGLSLGDALRRCHALDDHGLYWFEEPIVYNNFRGYAQLARELATPVQIGENFYGPRDVLRAAEVHACDHMMLDLMRVGGVSGWIRSAPIAAAAGIEVSTHLYPEFGAHLMKVTETAHWLEWQDWVNPVLAEPFELRRGQLTIPDRPGSGVDWDEKAVRRYRDAS